MIRRIEAVAIGASAGAVETLSHILPELPSHFDRPVFVVVHVPADGKSVLAELFRLRCAIPVKEAEATELICGGTVYFAPSGYHLQVERNGRLSLSVDEPVHFSRPSIDVLFETAADAYGPGLLGIVLTGANADGADGLRAIVDQGGQSVVQDPETAYARAMPEAARTACPSARILSPQEIGGLLATLSGGYA